MKTFNHFGPNRRHFFLAAATICIFGSQGALSGPIDIQPTFEDIPLRQTVPPAEDPGRQTDDDPSKAPVAAPIVVDAERVAREALEVKKKGRRVAHHEQFADNDAPAFDFEEFGGDFMMPDPLDQMMAIQGFIDAAWEGSFWEGYFDKLEKDIDPTEYTDKTVALPILLGIRICDGFIAARARNATKLGLVASDVERIGRALGAREVDLEGARRISRLADANKWTKVNTELSRLRTSILEALNDAQFRDRRALVFLGGWMQGASYASSVISDHPIPELRGILREPDLIQDMIKNLLELDSGKRKHPLVQRGMIVLVSVLDIVNVGPREPVPEPKVNVLHKITSQYISRCIAELKNK